MIWRPGVVILRHVEIPQEECRISGLSMRMKIGPRKARGLMGLGWPNFNITGICRWEG
jgi:hypothetical protein